MSGSEGLDQLIQTSSPQVSRGRPPLTDLPFLPQQARQNSGQGNISLVSLTETLGTGRNYMCLGRHYLFWPSLFVTEIKW